MKKGMTKLIALMLALALTLGASALAAETASDPYRVQGAQARPEVTEPAPETPAEGEPVEPAESTEPADPAEPEGTQPEATEPAAPAEPEEPAEPIGQKQVVLNDANDSVKVFAEASADSAVVDYAFHGDIVDVLFVNGAWTKIIIGGVKGYIASAHLKAVGAAEAEAPAEPEEPAAPETPVEPETPAEPQAVIGSKVVAVEDADGKLNVRAEASMDAAVLTTLPNGAKVGVLAAEGEWTKVRTADGVEGYVASRYLADEPAAPAEEPAEPAAPETPAEPEAPAEEPAAPAPEAPAAPAEEPAEEAVPSIEYERGEDGALVLDENGNPIPVLGEDATLRPVAFQRDAEGNLVLDENGNPIPSQFVPVAAEKIDTIEDELDPNRTIDLYADWGSDELHFGDEAQLYAVLNGYDNLVYTIQWQQSPDDATWTDIEGATSPVLTTVVTEENFRDYWRVQVFITDIVDEAA